MDRSWYPEPSATEERRWLMRHGSAEELAEYDLRRQFFHDLSRQRFPPVVVEEEAAEKAAEEAE